MDNTDNKMRPVPKVGTHIRRWPGDSVLTVTGYALEKDTIIVLFKEAGHRWNLFGPMNLTEVSGCPCCGRVSEDEA